MRGSARVAQAGKDRKRAAREHANHFIGRPTIRTTVTTSREGQAKNYTMSSLTSSSLQPVTSARNNRTQFSSALSPSTTLHQPLLSYLWLQRDKFLLYLFFSRLPRNTPKFCCKLWRAINFILCTYFSK